LASRSKRKRKETPITPYFAIEKLGLSTRQTRFNLQLSDLSDANRVTNPGKTGSNHLLPSHCETSISPFAKPDGMGLISAINPGHFKRPGFFISASSRLKICLILEVAKSSPY
jgi:hypothetical protein